MIEYKTQRVGKEDVKYMQLGSGEPLVFLHGFGYRPHYYDNGSFLEDLTEKQFEVILPEMFGLNCFEHQPTSVAEYAEFYHDFCSSLKIDKHHLVGHSMGGGVAFLYSSSSKDVKDVIGIDPLLPTDYGILGYVMRSLSMSTKELGFMFGEGLQEKLTAQTHAFRVSAPYVINVFRKPVGCTKST